MTYFKGPLIRSDGSPIIRPDDPHNCYSPTGWNESYSHTTVATILTNETVPSPEKIAFGHHDIMGMWFRHQERPFASLPIVPSEMQPEELFLPEWRM